MTSRYQENFSEEKERNSIQHLDLVNDSHSQTGQGAEPNSPATIKNHTDDRRERAFVRKLDRRILPIACLMYLFAFLDRSNLGNARLQGLPEDTLGGDPTGTKFDWVNSAFFFSYIICQVPMSLMNKLVSPRIWLASCAIGWGICSTLMATGYNFAGLIVTRVAIGFFEAGFGPGIPLYFSLFYVNDEMGLRMGYWLGFAAVAGAFGGLIAYGIQHAHATIANWRLLFIVEGIPAILLGIVALILLPDRPERSSFFTPEERDIAIERMNRRTKADVGNHVNRGHIKMAFLDWRVYVAGVIYFGVNCALASLSAFLPTIIKSFGYTNATAQILTVPPYAVAAVVLTMAAWTSDRLQSRGLIMAGASFVGFVGYLLLLVVPGDRHVQYFATFCVCSGTYTTIGVILSWFTQNLGSETKRATGIPMFMAIGQCGSILGSHLYKATEGPRYIKGFAVTGGLELLACLCCIILTISYRLDNRRRNRLHGKPTPGTSVDTTLQADKAPMFRYIP